MPQFYKPRATDFNLALSPFSPPCQIIKCQTEKTLNVRYYCITNGYNFISDSCKSYGFDLLGFGCLRIGMIICIAHNLNNVIRDRSIERDDYTDEIGMKKIIRGSPGIFRPSYLGPAGLAETEIRIRRIWCFSRDYRQPHTRTHVHATPI